MPIAQTDSSPLTALAGTHVRSRRPFTDNLLALLLLIGLNFVLPRGLPGDPVDALLGEDLVAGYSDAQLTQLKEAHGLSGSWWQQFGAYLVTLSQGDLGYSAQHAAPVAQLLADALPWTVLLMLSVIPTSLLIGVWPGLVAGARRGSVFDRVAEAVAALLSSFPAFAVGLLLLSVFGVSLSWFPIAGGTSLFADYHGWRYAMDIIWHTTLPVLALSLHGGVHYFYLARGVAEQLAGRAFIQAARERGIRGGRLLFHYFFRNALPILLGKVSTTLPRTLGAVLFVEMVFSYPGVGQLLLDAIHARDYPLIQGGLFVLGVLVLAINSALDALISALGRRG